MDVKKIGCERDAGKSPIAELSIRNNEPSCSIEDGELFD
jgi:hypothetical protein